MACGGDIHQLKFGRESLCENLLRRYTADLGEVDLSEVRQSKLCDGTAFAGTLISPHEKTLVTIEQVFTQAITAAPQFLDVQVERV